MATNLDDILARHQRQLALQAAPDRTAFIRQTMDQILSPHRERQKYLDEVHTGKRDFSNLKSQVAAKLMDPVRQHRRSMAQEAGVSIGKYEDHHSMMFDQMFAGIRKRQLSLHPAIPTPDQEDLQEPTIDPVMALSLSGMSRTAGKKVIDEGGDVVSGAISATRQALNFAPTMLAPTRKE